MPKYVDGAGLERFYGNIKEREVQTFDTVAAMQAATWLKSSMVAHTNGFHAAGDGGAAYYTVSASGTANGMDVLALQGGLFATLVVTEPYVTPEQFGAYGDDMHDDSAAIQAALATDYEVISDDSSKSYLVSTTITVSGANKTLSIAGHVKYHGTGAAIDVIGMYHKVYVSMVYATNGIGIRLYQTDYSVNTAYCRISFDYIEAQTGLSLYPTNHGVQNCWFNLGYIRATGNAVYIYGGDSANSSAPSYTGEVVFYNGRCIGNYAVYLDCTNGYEINKVCFDNVSFEGSENAIALIATSNAGKITATVFKNVRTDEITGTILNIVGNVRDGFFDGAAPFFASKIIAQSTADVNHSFEIRSKMYSGNGVASIAGANINLKGAMFKAKGRPLTLKANTTWQPDGNYYCVDTFIPAEGTFEFHAPYLAPDGTCDVYVNQTGSTRIAKIYGYNDYLIFDGTNKGAGNFHIHAVDSGSPNYALWYKY